MSLLLKDKCLTESWFQQLESIVAKDCNRLTEFRICLPMTTKEYQIAQLWSVAEASKNETGGGDGLEVLVNEEFFPGSQYAPIRPLIGNNQQHTKGQYTKKIYHLSKKIPGIFSKLAPKGSLEFHEDAWNAYPYCRTIITNPIYMKDKFYIIIESFHADGRGDLDGVHGYTEYERRLRLVVPVDISSSVSCNETADPVMCCYKSVKVLFKWFGFQNRLERFILSQERRLFHNFHRQLFCWLDQWCDLNMDDIRRVEEDTKKELDMRRDRGAVQGTVASEQ